MQKLHSRSQGFDERLFLLASSEWYLNLTDLKFPQGIFWLCVSYSLDRLAIHPFKPLTSSGKTTYEMKELRYFRQ